MTAELIVGLSAVLAVVAVFVVAIIFTARAFDSMRFTRWAIRRARAEERREILSILDRLPYDKVLVPALEQIRARMEVK